MWDDYHPYLYETTDYGAHWTTRANGIPDNQYAFVVRQDPSEPRLLFAGTRSTVYVSLDGGGLWQPLTLNLPGVQVRDLAIDSREGELVAATHGGKMSLSRAKGECDAVLRSAGLTHRAETPAGQLGLLDMKQLELAKALAVRPRLLLLDEIAGGLTEAETETLLATIRQVHAGGVTVIWIEHVVQTLRRLATKLVVLHGGGVLASGPPESVIADPRVKDAYLGK